MNTSEDPVEFSRPVTTVDQLVEQLSNSPPGDFIGTTFPLIDNRGGIEQNLFTFAVISDQVNRLLAQGVYGDPGFTYTRERGESMQFGLLYETQIQAVETLEEPRELRAKRIKYAPRKSFLWLQPRFFHPDETLVLGGEDHTQNPFLMEITKYRKGGEAVDVYKMISGTGETARRVFIVGRPNWDLKTQRGIARGLRMPVR
jgi:hypothetical protein